MGRRGSRTFLAPNISEDGSGLSVKVTVGGKTIERRFPRGTPLSELETERDRLKGQQQGRARPVRAGTLGHDIRQYLRTVQGTRTLKDQAALLAHWLPYWELHRFALTPLVIQQQLASWRQQGAAASSCNHRLSALRAVFRTVNDPNEPNFPAQVRPLSQPPPEPKALDYPTVINRILAAMPDKGKTAKGETRSTVSLTKLRCRLMAYTGLPWAQMAKIDPETDIDWETPALRARPRRKGKGTRETWLPLIPPAVEALRELVAAKGFTGPFSHSSVHSSFQRAARAVIETQIRNGETPLPHRIDARGRIIPKVSPYWLRHSFATLALLHSNDQAAVTHLLQHSSGSQTGRYTLAAIPAGAARAAALMAVHVAGAPRDEAKDRGTEAGETAKSAKTGRKTSGARSSGG